MPIHRVAIDAQLEARIAEIEMTERIVQTSTAGEGCLLVITEPRNERRPGPGGVEKRPA